MIPGKDSHIQGSLHKVNGNEETSTGGLPERTSRLSRMQQPTLSINIPPIPMITILGRLELAIIFSSPFQYITHPSFTIQGDYDLTSHLSSYREYILMAQRVKEQFLECMKKGSDVAGNDNPQGDNDAESCAAFAKRQVRP